MKKIKIIIFIMLILVNNCLNAEEYYEGYENSYAVCIGINEYKNFRKLNTASKDAKMMKEILLKYGFKEVRLILDEEATEKNILSSFNWLKEVSRKNDRIVFYFAGHGKTEKGLRGDVSYIIPYDAPSENYTLYSIPISTIKEKSKIIEAKHILYLMDSCYSGSVVNERSIERDNIFFEEMTKKSVVYMITGGSAGEETLENEKNGLFTYYLLRGLEGEADYDKNKIITASELGVYTKKRVYQKSKEYNKIQTPQMGIIDGEGEIVFDLLEYQTGIKREKIQTKNINNQENQNLEEIISKLKIDIRKELEEKQKINIKKKYDSNFNITVNAGYGISFDAKEKIIEKFTIESTLKLKKDYRLGLGYSNVNWKTEKNFIYENFKESKNIINTNEDISKIYLIFEKRNMIFNNEYVSTYDLKCGMLSLESLNFYISSGISLYKNKKIATKYSIYLDVYSLPKYEDYYKEYNILGIIAGLKIGIKLF